MAEAGLDLSVIIPCFNEAENLRRLWQEMTAAFPITGEFATETVLVDDGSTDATSRILTEIAESDPRLVPLTLTPRQGQTAALWAGLGRSRGRWIAHLDGDLQNDPADLPPMLRHALAEGLDAVLGYRETREDNIGRRLSSYIANTVRRSVLGDTIRDIGCSTRVVRRDVLAGMPPVRNMHRYLPALIEKGGWRFTQLPVRHYRRRHGLSKYGNLARGIEGLRDLPRIRSYIRTLQSCKGGESRT